MMTITAEKIVELFEKDPKSRKRLAEILVTEPDIRLAIINAVLKDVSTKQDIAELRKTLEKDLARLEDNIENVRKELKEEITATKQDIAELRKTLEKDLARLEDNIENVRKELKEEITATKQDIAELRKTLENRIEREVSRLEAEIDRLYKLLLVSVIGILISIITTILIRIIMP